MDKYISADKLRAMMYHGAFEEDSDLQRWDSGCWIRYKMFKNALEQIEPADVQEVRHGRWIRSKLPITGAIEHKCSVCETPYYMAFAMKMNYCPNCGSRMDEVEERSRKEAEHGIL